MLDLTPFKELLAEDCAYPRYQTKANIAELVAEVEKLRSELEAANACATVNGKALGPLLVQRDRLIAALRDIRDLDYRYAYGEIEGVLNEALGMEVTA